MSDTDNFICSPPHSCFICPFEDCIKGSQKVTFDEVEFSKCREPRNKSSPGQPKICNITLHICRKTNIL